VAEQHAVGRTVCDGFRPQAKHHHVGGVSSRCVGMPQTLREHPGAYRKGNSTSQPCRLWCTYQDPPNGLVNTYYQVKAERTDRRFIHS
jgi:hypothetical protein